MTYRRLSPPFSIIPGYCFSSYAFPLPGLTSTPVRGTATASYNLGPGVYNMLDLKIETLERVSSELWFDNRQYWLKPVLRTTTQGLGVRRGSAIAMQVNNLFGKSVHSSI